MTLNFYDHKTDTPMDTLSHLLSTAWIGPTTSPTTNQRTQYK